MRLLGAWIFVSFRRTPIRQPVHCHVFVKSCFGKILTYWTIFIYTCLFTTFGIAEFISHYGSPAMNIYDYINKRTIFFLIFRVDNEVVSGIICIILCTSRLLTATDDQQFGPDLAADVSYWRPHHSTKTTLQRNRIPRSNFFSRLKLVIQ